MKKVLSLAAPLIAALTVVTPAFCQSTPLISLESQEVKAVKVPYSVTKLEDDGVCTLRWNGFPNQGDAAAGKFEIQWGGVSEGFVRNANTTANTWQAQPLYPGITYQAQIRAVDRWGRASAWSPAIYFTPNSARVDAIRAQCSVPGGFFDDFNLPAGKPDWLKWNFAVNRYTDEAKNGMFVNDQLHAHMMIASLRNDRSQIVSRPRNAVLDLSDNGTRNIYIDMDLNPDPRNTWYLDFIPDTQPDLYDITTRNTVDINERKAFDPPNMLRVTIQGTHIYLVTGDAQGVLTQIASCDPGAMKGIYAKANQNVRRPFKFTVSRSLIEVYVHDLNGVYTKVLSAPISLSWTKARVFNSCFGYNTAKNGLPAWLFHFDNFGFDAPAGAAPNPVIYDYKTQLTNGNEYGGANAAYTIKIPDAVAGWNHRLFCTVMKSTGNSSNYKLTPVSTVTVNGQTFNIPAKDDMGRSVAIDLPAGCIVQGDNNIKFKLTSTGVMNIHIEATRPANDTNSLPPYTTHCQIYGCSPMPSLDLGSDPTIITIEKYATWMWDFKTPIVVSGQITVDGRVSNVTCVTASGKPADIDRIEFQIDKQAVFSRSMMSDTLPVYGKYRFYLDTTQLTNGVHELFFESYTPEGFPGNPAYFERGSFNGQYFPILIDVQN